MARTIPAARLPKIQPCRTESKFALTRVHFLLAYYPTDQAGKMQANLRRTSRGASVQESAIPFSESPVTPKIRSTPAATRYQRE
ncbi:MAG TPA: hypothetical protein VFK06_06080, partial [Candidatus Angelobacter sp.]|nr:hypothetical protein [Candidatus Angelobacter sp.]